MTGQTRIGPRAYFVLAVASLAGTVCFLLWMAAVLAGLMPKRPPAQLVASVPFLLITCIVVWPQNEAERLLARSATGSHPSNRRRALGSCFAPYRPRSARRVLRRGPLRLIAIFLTLLAGALMTGMATPLFSAQAFILALRRAAWLGHRDAQLMEADWLQVRGPVREGRGARLAARSGAR